MPFFRVNQIPKEIWIYVLVGVWLILLSMWSIKNVSTEKINLFLKTFIRWTGKKFPHICSFFSVRSTGVSWIFFQILCKYLSYIFKSKFFLHFCAETMSPQCSRQQLQLPQSIPENLVQQAGSQTARLKPPSWVPRVQRKEEIGERKENRKSNLVEKRKMMMNSRNLNLKTASGGKGFASP